MQTTSTMELQLLAMTWTNTSPTLQLVLAIVAIVFYTVLILAATRHSTMLHEHPSPTSLHDPVMETSTAQGTLVLWKPARI